MKKALAVLTVVLAFLFAGAVQAQEKPVQKKDVKTEQTAKCSKKMANKEKCQNCTGSKCENGKAGKKEMKKMMPKKEEKKSGPKATANCCDTK